MVRGSAGRRDAARGEPEALNCELEFAEQNVAPWRGGVFLFLIFLFIQGALPFALRARASHLHAQSRPPSAAYFGF